MARGVNKVIIVGNLGSDPETRYVPSGSAVTNFSIAATESWKDKQTGEKREFTEWVRVEVWGKLAEICTEYLAKGSMVYVEGKLRTDSWDDKDTGQKKYSTKVRADTVQFLGSKRDGSASKAPAPPPQGQEFDDDIPF